MRLVLIAAAVLISGCAASLHSQGRQYIQQGQTWSGISTLQQAVGQGDYRAWNDLGVGYERAGERERAIQAYTMAARYGDPVAQQNLINLGAPVPTPDLANSIAQNRAANAAQSAATLQMIQALQPRPAPFPAIQPTINCTSNRFGNTVNTTCN